MKIKPFTGMKICKGGELYKFKKGIAIVPNMWINGKQVVITIQEFLQENKS